MANQLSIHQKLNTKLYKDLVRLLNKENVPFWLDFDTLLGVWSTKTGKDLSREKNIYLSIDQKHLKLLQNALKKNSFLYRIHSFVNRSGRKWVSGKDIVLGIFNGWKRTSYSFKIFISIKYKQKDEFRWIDIRNE